MNTHFIDCVRLSVRRKMRNCDIARFLGVKQSTVAVHLYNYRKMLAQGIDPLELDGIPVARLPDWCADDSWRRDREAADKFAALLSGGFEDDPTSVEEKLATKHSLLPQVLSPVGSSLGGAVNYV